jgi:hypothetical protein
MRIDIEERIQEIWGEQGLLALPICAAANQFQQWAAVLCTEVARIAQQSNDDGIIAVNQAYVRLITKYFDWRSAVPKAHRNCISETGHTCIFQIFERAYQQLRVIELSLTPPLLFPPSAPAAPMLPAPPVVYSIAGISLAEKEDEE